MPKLLVNQPSGKQEIIEITESGGYFDLSRVVWDERTDGALPEITIGKMQRNGSQLVTLEEYLPEHAEAIYQESVPHEITRRQAVLALYDAGMLLTVKSWVASVGGELEIYWDTSPVFRRNHAFVDAARIELALTHQQMDGLFISADTKER